jgi:Amt family ammonium transporter
MVSPTSAVVIGLVSGLVVYAFDTLLQRMKIDDAIGAIPIHGCAGAWGTLAVALFGDPTAWAQGGSRWDQLLIQATGVGVTFVWAFGLTFVVLKIVHKFYPLRVTAEEEHAGLNVSEHGVMTAMIDLLSEMETHRVTGDFSSGAAVEPHTEVGQIATQYNRLIDEVNSRNKKMAGALDEARDAKNTAEQFADEVKVFNDIAVERELMMVDLKNQVNQLLTDLNQPPEYDMSQMEISKDNEQAQKGTQTP